MNELRAILATIISCISSYLVYDLFANGFDWVVLLVCLGGYMLVHYIWPNKVDGDSDWYDMLEIVVDLPYRTIAFTLRTVGRAFRKGDIDVGIDL